MLVPDFVAKLSYMARRVTKKKRAKKPAPPPSKRKKAKKKPPPNDLGELTLVSAVFEPDPE